MGSIFRGILFLALTTGAISAQSQEVWDLQKCIAHALENNLQIKQQLLQTEMSQVNATAAKGALLPTVNAFGSHTYNWGQRIDPFTNTFASTRVRSNNFFLNSNFTVFSGLQKMNAVKQSELDYKAGQYGVDKTRNDIAVFLASTYLQILFNQELLENAQNQQRITQQQVNRIKKLVDAGSLPQGSLYDIQAQLAMEEVNVVQAENNLDISYLNLKQFLQMESGEQIAISRPTINIDNMLTIVFRPGQIYDVAVKVLPEIKRAEYNLASADKGISIAQGAQSPTLSINASYGTGYSGLAQEIVSVSEDGTQTIGFVQGSNALVVTPAFATETRTQAFGTQIENNLNRTLGIQLNIPILNGFSAKSNISRARLSRDIAEHQLDIEKNTIRLNVEQAYADAQAALKQYKATEISVAALKESFNYAQKRFDVGLMNSVDYNDSKNNLARSESDLVRAKYDFVFKTKILDFYQGRPIGL